MHLLETIDIDELLPHAPVQELPAILTAEDLQRLDAIQIAYEQSSASGKWTMNRIAG